MRQLNQDIGDVTMIMKDLARIVHDQGDIVDSIEANVESASIQVEQVKRAEFATFSLFWLNFMCHFIVFSWNDYFQIVGSSGREESARLPERRSPEKIFYSDFSFSSFCDHRFGDLLVPTLNFLKTSECAFHIHFMGYAVTSLLGRLCSFTFEQLRS